MEKKVIKTKHTGRNLPEPGIATSALSNPAPPEPVSTIIKVKKSNPPPGYSPREPLEFSKWISTRQLLEEFPVSARSLYNWRKKCLLPFTFFEGKLLYDRTAFERILKSRWNIGPDN